MVNCSPRLDGCAAARSSEGNAATDQRPRVEVALLTGGFDKPYALGLAMALASKGVRVEYIGNDDVDSPELHTVSEIKFFNLLSESRGRAGLPRKIARVLACYARLIRYAAVAQPKIFHILWNNKFHVFDRTVLMLYYKLLGKKIAYTAHNVNACKRDFNDSIFNRLTLRFQYRVVDCIFVHTEAMKSELIKDFGVLPRAVTVIPFGINDSVPNTELAPREAKRRLGIGSEQRTILFFGHIGPYKGLEHLVAAFQRIVARDGNYRLIIAGKPRGGCEKYVTEIQEAINHFGIQEHVIQKIEYIPDSETEVYFKAADLLVLPYRVVYQSGVLFLGYNFGLPVVATDVGSFREDVIEGKTGFLCRPCDPIDLAETIEKYFGGDLYRTVSSRRREIQEYAKERYSWDQITKVIRNGYFGLQGRESLRE